MNAATGPSASVEWSTGRFESVVSWADWDEKLEDLATLHVDVVPVGFPTEDGFELEARGRVVFRPMIDIGVRYRFDLGSSQVDGVGRIDFDTVGVYEHLLEQIAEFFAANRFVDTGAIVWQSVDFRTAFDRDTLRRLGQYLGIVRVAFDFTKDAGAANQ